MYIKQSVLPAISTENKKFLQKTFSDRKLQKFHMPIQKDLDKDVIFTNFYTSNSLIGKDPNTFIHKSMYMFNFT